MSNQLFLDRIPCATFNYRVRQITFFYENALKKLLNIFSKFFFFMKHKNDAKKVIKFYEKKKLSQQFVIYLIDLALLE